jgi:hypothetical protein
MKARSGRFFPYLRNAIMGKIEAWNPLFLELHCSLCGGHSMAMRATAFS